jgi:sec-independent protein translocase protein TatC
MTGVNEKELTVFEHLEELRFRLLVCLGALLAAAAASFAYVDRIRHILTRPAGELIYLGVSEAFAVNIKLALVCGLLISLPVIFFQLWRFILPGLYRHERGAVLFISLISAFFFLLGALFGFFVVLPFTISFFLGFAGEQLAPMFSYSSYVSYSLSLLLGFGLVFEMPVLVLILARLGIVSADFLARQRKFAVVIIFILAALFTPPDVISQFLLGVPMLLLYELSILLARVAGRRYRDDVDNQ